MLRTDALDYHLPEDRIATAPVSPRDSARLMILRKSDPESITHAHVRDLPGFLQAGDTLVINRTRVLPARFRGHRADTRGKAEGLFVSERNAGGADADPAAPPRWHVLLKLRRMKPGVMVNLDAADGSRSGVWLELIERLGPGDEDDVRPDSAGGGWLAEVHTDRTWSGADPANLTKRILDRIGLPPLPPYILASRKRHELPIDDPRDRDTYQTVYALDQSQEQRGHGEHGSVAAPTAGLHFTPELLKALASRGVSRAEVLLHVGLGTFKPVESEFVEQHAMHTEWCSVPASTAQALNSGRASGRIIAVGTTTARTLESFASLAEMLASPAKDTRLLITPGYRFKHLDALMTNFHLPRSTLLAMVAAFLDDSEPHRGRGLERLMTAYREAIDRGYRFYSYGDAMIVLP